VAMRLALVGQAVAPAAGQSAANPEQCSATTPAAGAQDEHHARIGQERARGARLEIHDHRPRIGPTTTLLAGQGKKLGDTEGLGCLHHAARRHAAH
jgi:hypothetical protein